MEKEIPKLWAHQLEAVKRARLLNNFALLFEPGTGKTATLISILREKYQTYEKLFPTVIFCPPVVVQNWKNEFLYWSKIPQKKIHCLLGPGREKATYLKQLDRESIVITNYESLNQGPVLDELKLFLSSQPVQALVLDESHRCKAISAKRTLRAIELADLCQFRYILTGTPILNSLMDVFAQFRILDRGERFSKNFWAFRARFFEDKNRAMPKNRYFPNWQPMRGAEKQIKQLIEPVSMHVEKAQCLDLPPLVKKAIAVPLSPEQDRLYKAMKQHLVATLTTAAGEDKVSVAELAITKALRLQQIVSGHLRVEDEQEGTQTIQIKENPRKEALRELLEDLTPNHKVLVWAVFHANYADIRATCDELGVGYAELHGGINNRSEQISRFDNDESCRVLIGHPGSGGIGVNLVAASYSIFYSRSFNLEFDLQAEARNYRGGSERHVSITRIDLFTPGTIDEVVMKSLASKVAISNSVLKDLLLGEKDDGYMDCRAN